MNYDLNLWMQAFLETTLCGWKTVFELFWFRLCGQWPAKQGQTVPDIFFSFPTFVHIFCNDIMKQVTTVDAVCLLMQLL